jgi:hypothetical protein
VLNGMQRYDTDNLAVIMAVNISQSLSPSTARLQKLGFCADKLLTSLSGWFSIGLAIYLPNNQPYELQNPTPGVFSFLKPLS